MRNSDRRNSSGPSSQYMESSMDEDYLEEEQEYTLPPNGWISSIIIGSIGGFIALAAPITTVLINASLYSEESRLGENTPYQIVATITLWQCSAVFIDLFLAFIVGMFAGRIVVKRKLSFLAGMLVGGIIYLGIFFVHYIPGYPEIINSNATTSNTGTALPGILFSIVLLAAWAVVGGLTSLCGAWVTTRKHPYYRSRKQE